MNAWQGIDRRCSAMNRDGERCGRAPIRGGTTCILHGGGSPNAQAAAKMRLLAMVEPVLGVFESIVEGWHRTACPTCGLPTGNPLPVIKVGQLVLDRAGFHPTLTIQQEAPAAGKYAHLTDDEVVEKLQQMLATAIERRDLHRRSQLPAQATEGVILDEGFPLPDDDDPAWAIPSGRVTISENTPENAKETDDNEP